MMHSGVNILQGSQGDLNEASSFVLHRGSISPCDGP